MLAVVLGGGDGRSAVVVAVLRLGAASDADGVRVGAVLGDADVRGQGGPPTARWRGAAGDPAAAERPVAERITRGAGSRIPCGGAGLLGGTITHPRPPRPSDGGGLRRLTSARRARPYAPRGAGAAEAEGSHGSDDRARER